MIRRARRVALTALRRLVEAQRPTVLMYHRVAELECDPWQLAVSPANFGEQIQLLKDEFHVVPLAWLARKLQEGKSPRRAVAVTFDDGYCDVLSNAKPVLERQGCPATVFLTTDAIGSRGGFWWDALSRILLEAPSLPDALELELEGGRHRWLIAGPEECVAPGAVTRVELHRAVWERLRLLGRDGRSEALGRLAAWAGSEGEPRQSHRALTWEEVCQLSEPGFIDIGAHTLSHPSLPAMRDDDKAIEVAASRRVCASVIGDVVEGFSYPFGDYDEASVAAVRSAGFLFACTTETRRVARRDHRLQLPRITVMNWSAREFSREALRPC